MRSSRRVMFVFIAMLMAVGGLFSAMGAVAQEQAEEVAQPGGDLPGDPSIELVQVADGLIDPVNVAAPNDDSGRLFIVERTGTIRILQDGELLEEPFLDISDSVKIDFLEQGLLGLAFHPDYANNGRFFVFYEDYRTNGDHFIVEYNVSEEDPNVADPDSFRVILTADNIYVNHDGGTILFGPDGYLYITFGDGGLAGDPYDQAQDPKTLHGSILRLNVDNEGGEAYGIPEDNPFAPGGVQVSAAANEAAQTGEYKPGRQSEIFVYGLRNAWQFSFDPETGDMYIADVGQNAWEEINFIPADEVTTGGHNFGWPYLEGAHCYPASEEEACDFFGELPVAEYSHERGCSITGIGVYRDGGTSGLDGVYFTSDFCSGRVWGLAQDDAGTWQFEELLDTELLVTGSGRGADGELYVTVCECQFGRDYDPFENPAGTVWQIVPADEVPEGAETAPAGEPAVEEEEVEGEGAAGTPAAEATPEE